MKRLATLAATAALAVALCAPAAADQTFWQLSTGAVPSPWPSPSSYPVSWYGVLYYPVFWPVCVPPGTRHCRPRRAPVWPPHVPAGQHPVPAPRPPR